MTKRGDGGFKAITKAAWSEFKTAADYSTGMGEVMRATTHPPRAFLEEELGFGAGCGTTLIRSLVEVAPRTEKRLADERNRRERREHVQAQEREAASATLATRHRRNRLSAAGYQRLIKAKVRQAQASVRAAAEAAA